MSAGLGLAARRAGGTPPARLWGVVSGRLLAAVRVLGRPGWVRCGLMATSSSWMMEAVAYRDRLTHYEFDGLVRMNTSLRKNDPCYTHRYAQSSHHPLD